MARGGKRRESTGRRELPPPLPPGARTVGQLVAETIRVYQHNFWRALAIGLLPGLAGVAGAALSLSRWETLLFTVAVGTPVCTLSYVAGCALVTGAPARGKRTVLAFCAGVLVFPPFALLVYLYVLPGLAWLSLFGFVVPAVLVEGLGLRDAFRRSLELARSDFVHVLGGLSTLVIIVVLSQGVVYLLLRSFADTAQLTSGSLAAVVLSPLLFLGGAMLYGDQVARVGSSGRRTRRRDADLPDADHAHREGRPDAQVQPGSPP